MLRQFHSFPYRGVWYIFFLKKASKTSYIFHVFKRKMGFVEQAFFSCRKMDFYLAGKRPRISGTILSKRIRNQVFACCLKAAFQSATSSGSFRYRPEVFALVCTLHRAKSTSFGLRLNWQTILHFFPEARCNCIWRCWVERRCSRFLLKRIRCEMLVGPPTLP